MTSPLGRDDAKTETEPRISYSSYLYFEDANVAQIDPYADDFGDLRTFPTSTNATDYSTFSPSNTWSPGAAIAAFDLQFAAAIHSPLIPPHYISILSTTSSNGIDSIAINGWQIDVDSLVQTDPGVPWECTSSAGSGSHDNITSASETLKTSISNMHNDKTNSQTLSFATTYENQYGDLVDSLQPSPQWKRKDCDDAEPRQEAIPKSEGSGPTIAPASTADTSKAPIPRASDISSDPPDRERHVDPRPTRRLKKISPISEMPQTIQSPQATSRSDKRARNRTAAVKCRTKNKAAIAELEATEKALSSRHRQLRATLRGLQADVFALKSEILLHANCGEGHIQDYVNNAAKSLTLANG